MTVHEVRASGRDYLALATELLQRTRRAHPEAGQWEAADLQWWWRQPRPSDGIEQLFWVDEHGPAAGIVLTAWDGSWQCDPVVVADNPTPVDTLVRRAADHAASLGIEVLETLVRDDDHDLLRAMGDHGPIVAGDRDGTMWLDVRDRPEPTPTPRGFALVDRIDERDEPHPMRRRNGDAVAVRLAECSLYDPALDLAVRAPDGQVAGYALFWADPVTQVGLVEPVRVEDAYQRRGIARALLAAGLHRLASRGMRRMKVSYETAAARALYIGAGFRPTATSTSFTWWPSGST